MTSYAMLNYEGNQWTFT